MRGLRLTTSGILVGTFVVIVLAAGCAVPTQSRAQAGATASTATKTRTPVSGGTIVVSPPQGGPGTRITVSGLGWNPGDTLGLRFEDPANQGQGTTYASATVAADGKVTMLITFPYDQQWASLPQVRLVMWSLEREQSAATVFRVTAVAPTSPATTLPTSNVSRSPTASAFVPATPTAAAGTSNAIAVVQSVGLNVRTGPGTEYTSFLVVSAGTRLQVTGQNAAGDWIRVLLPGSKEGWVSRAMTDYRGSAQVVSVSAVVSTATQTRATSTSSPTRTASPSPSPSPSPTPVITEWKGEYWTTVAMTGTPALVRNDTAIDFDWSTGTPATGLPVDNFSVRWSRTVNFEAGSYRFRLSVDDGARVRLDNQVLIDEWHDGSERSVQADAVLSAGAHTLVVEYYEKVGRALARFSWEKLSAPTSFQNWKGEYYANRTLSGSPALVRDDSAVSFDWGTGAPAFGLPADDFSVRWSRSYNFDPGLYRLSVRADDGVRIYVEGQKVLDRWYDGDATQTQTVDLNLLGPRVLVVEYYDHLGGAKIDFSWQSVGQMVLPTPKAGVPQVGSAGALLAPLSPPKADVLAVAPRGVPLVAGDGAAASLAAPDQAAAEHPVLFAGAWVAELLANPRRDWNGDGTQDQKDQWIRLANSQAGAADLSGCILDNGGKGRYVLAAGTVIQPGGILVLFGDQTGALLSDSGGALRFFAPDGRVLDQVTYPPLAADSSYVRTADGRWHESLQAMLAADLSGPLQASPSQRPSDQPGWLPPWLRRLLSIGS